MAIPPEYKKPIYAYHSSPGNEPPKIGAAIPESYQNHGSQLRTRLYGIYTIRALQLRQAIHAGSPEARGQQCRNPPRPRLYAADPL